MVQAFCLLGATLSTGRLAGGLLALAGESPASQQYPDVTHAGTCPAEQKVCRSLCRQGGPRARSKPHLEGSAAGLKRVLAEERAAGQKEKIQLAEGGQASPRASRAVM